MLRVLFVNENLGGHRTLHLHLRAALAERDDVVADFVDVPPPSILRRVLALPIPGLDRLDIDLQPLRGQLAAALWVRRHIARRAADYDVLHVYSQNAGLLSADIIGSMPSVVSTDSTNEVNGWTIPYRDSGRFTGATIRLTRRLEEPVLEAATTVVAQSEWIRGSLVEHYGLGPDIPVIPFGITVPDMPSRSVLVPPRVTYVGMSMGRKGGYRLLDAFRRLDVPAQLTLVTPIPVPPEPGVTVVPDISPGDPRLTDILASTSVLALPSEIDKASYAVLEGMAHGAAVVATNIGAVREIVDDGISGLVIEPGDQDALYTALRTLVADPDLARRMGDAGRERLETVFDARRTTAMLLDVLSEAYERFHA